MEQVDIAIIGGGLVGASLALALQDHARRQGWSIRLIEAAEPGSAGQPSYDARASALAEGTCEQYRKLGIWPRIAERAEPIRHIHVSEQGRFGMTRLHAEEEGVTALGHVIENAWIGQVLWSALDFEVIRCSAPETVTSITAGAAGYQLQLGSGEQLQARLTILADGGRSSLRSKLGVAVRTRSYHQAAIVANVSVEAPHQGWAYERFLSNGALALLPMSGQRCALVWSQPLDVAESLRSMSEAAFLQRLQDAFGFRLGRFFRVGARHAYPLMLSESAEQVRSGLVVLGNAAHSLHPIAGQGYNLSLRDALALAEHLTTAEAPLGSLSVLQAYQRAQLRDQRMTIDFSDRLVRLFGQRDPLVGAGRSLGLLGLDLTASLKGHFARQAMGLGIRG